VSRHEYDYDSPLSENAQDALINSYLHLGGRVGLASEETLAELITAGYITKGYNLTGAGLTEGIRLWQHYWEIQFNRSTYRQM
jgi:hypothetical protein